MTIALILNLVFAAFVVIGIVGVLAWSIASQDREALTGVPAKVRPARRRRQAPARARILGRTAGSQA